MIRAGLKRCSRCTHLLRVAMRLRRDIRSIKVSACKVCGGEFPARHLLRSLCSVECKSISRLRAAAAGRKRPSQKAQRKAWKAKRRGAWNVTNVEPDMIFERDGWRCRGCGCETPRALRGTNADDAPELDHIEPVATGGSHEEANLQTLCRLCNLLKGALPMSVFVSRYFKA